MPPTKGKKPDALTQSQPSTRTSTASQEADDDVSIHKAACLSPEMQVFLSTLTSSIVSALNTSVEKIIEEALDKKTTQRMDMQSAEIFELNKRID